MRRFTAKAFYDGGVGCEGGLAEYANEYPHGEPVCPETLRRWANEYETFDHLAALASDSARAALAERFGCYYRETLALLVVAIRDHDARWGTDRALPAVHGRYLDALTAIVKRADYAREGERVHSWATIRRRYS